MWLRRCSGSIFEEEVVATLAQILKRCARSMVEEVNKTNG
jgi:hypothetical protein